ncbi:MAG: hypothetical protein L0Z53_25880, partial [Acidobacteriales bacterium]|nr:hypothetical protein [Terriglobales bacterium]
MPSINREWCEITKAVITEAQEQMNSQLISPLFAELPGISVRELAREFFERMLQLQEFAISISLDARTSERPDLDSALVPLFKAIFLRARLAKARELDQQRSKTTNPQVIAALEDKLKMFDGIIREGWFQAAVPEYPPAMSDVLTLERVEKLETATYLQERQYDEKFHLLQSPNLLRQDLHYYRVKCGMRGISVAIA